MSHRNLIDRCRDYAAAWGLLCAMSATSVVADPPTPPVTPTLGPGNAMVVGRGWPAIGLLPGVVPMWQEDVRQEHEAAAAGTGGTATLLDGQEFQGRLVELTSQGEWLFSQAGQPVTVARDQLVMWGRYRDRSEKPWVLLTDGSLLAAELLSIDRENVVLAGQLWSDTRVPRQHVRAIVFRPAVQELARDRLFYRALTEVRAEDQLLLENGDELKGQMPSEVKPEPGAFHPQRIRWSVSGSAEPVDMPLDRVSAVFMATHQHPPAMPDNAVWIGLMDGSRVLAAGMRHSGKSLQFDLACGAQLVTDAAATPAGQPYDAVIMLQPLTTAATFLSNLEPLGYKHIPFLAVNWPYWNDRSVAGGQLRLDGHVYLKGLGMHSSSRLAYPLGGQYRSLQAELALDQCAGREGSVVYRVYLQDSAGQWTKAFESGIVRGGQAPVAMRVDVRGAEALALIVDFADRADQWDHANWLNARLLR